MMVAGMTTFMIRGKELAEMVNGEIIAAIPIDSMGSVMFEPMSVPMATP